MVIAVAGAERTDDFFGSPTPDITDALFRL
jgi:hypothetical protein